VPFIKVIKSKAYFKRYQVQFRRRREGKTDYQARKALIVQDKNKYNSPKYRLIVRFTNRDVIAQLAFSKLVGDRVVAAAYSHELPRYGLKVGLTNYAAAYATGLLLARRCLLNIDKEFETRTKKKLGLFDAYKGQEKLTGEDYNVEEKEGAPRPFYALLDVGLARTTTGARVFAALKGACDGGLNVPHSDSRFVGFGKDKKLDAKKLRSYLLGGHVAAYMKKLQSDNKDKYERQFSQYIKAGVTGDNLEKLYESVFAAIRKDPSFKSTRTKPKFEGKPKRFNAKRRTLPQRKDRVRQILASRAAKATQ